MTLGAMLEPVELGSCGLLERADNPKLPQALPRQLPVDVDRRMTEVLTRLPKNAWAAGALRLQRSCGLRIGELLDLEMNCVHEVPDADMWPSSAIRACRETPNSTEPPWNP